MTGRCWLGLGCALLVAAGCTSNLRTLAAPSGAGTAGASTGATARPTLVLKPTPSPAPTSAPTLFKPHTIDEPTRYEGTLKYDCEADGCWRQGSRLEAAPEALYPQIDGRNAEIDALLADIGLPTAPIKDDATAWSTLRSLWDWLRVNAKAGEAAPEAWAYLGSLSFNAKPGHWQSIADLAATYARYHVLPWGACSSRAITFATLAYRVGFNPDRLSVAYFRVLDPAISHVYVVIRSGDHWHYVDPSCNTSAQTAPLPAEPTSIGCIERVDYAHPHHLDPLPGSKLTRAMLLS